MQSGKVPKSFRLSLLSKMKEKLTGKSICDIFKKVIFRWCVSPPQRGKCHEEERKVDEIPA